MNNGIVSEVRPSTLDDVVGMSHNKRTVEYQIKGSLALQQPLPSFILVGPPGTGKSSMADVISAIIPGVNKHKFLGSDFKKVEDLYAIVGRLNDGDIVTIEEAETLNKYCQAVLLEWMENHRILGGAEYNILQAPKVCFIFPTTNAGRMSHAFRTRCILLSTSYYSVGDLKQILVKAGIKLNIDLTSDDAALTLLAQCSRGTPRIAIMHRLDMLRKIMVVDGLEFNLDTVIRMLKLNQINEWGLESNDLNYCQVLYKKIIENKNKPISLKTLVQSTGLADDVIQNVIEAYLQQIGVIKIEPRGRILTDFGCKIMGFDPISADPMAELQQINIDLEYLKALLEDPKTRSGGMKAIAPKLNLRYGIDNHIMLAALGKLGYTSKRSVGIIPL